MSKSKQILYTCLKCGANISSPWLYAPCPVCGWRGTKPISDRAKQENAQRDDLKKEVLNALENAYPNLNINSEKFRKRYARAIKAFKETPRRLGDVFKIYTHNGNGGNK
jgi:predicted  nucleic acid-binding Zn-ribbon protein